METFSALLALCVENSPVTGDETFGFFLWSAPEKKAWVNNRDAIVLIMTSL